MTYREARGDGPHTVARGTEDGGLIDFAGAKEAVYVVLDIGISVW